MQVTLLMTTLLLWPYSVGILVRFTSFLGTLHWPSGSADLGHWPSGSVDLGHFGVSFLELLILFEQWAGHRLLSEKAARPHIRAGRPISLPSVPVSEGIEIRHGCQFLSSLLRALCKLPGGLGRFLPCRLGPHLSRLRHVGWNQCSHGLDSRPLESCHHQCLKAVCGLLGYPQGSALELLDGTLKLRYCTTLFTKRFPPWSLPRVGSRFGKRHLVSTDHLLDVHGTIGRRVRLTKKTRPGISSHDIPDPVPGHSTPRRWKRLLLPSSEGERERWACLAIFFLALGLGDFALGNAWNLLPEATGVVGYRLDSPAEEASTLVLAFLISCMRACE